MYASSTTEQFGTLMRRGLMEKKRDSRTTVTSIIRAVVIGLFMGSLFWQQETCGEVVRAQEALPFMGIHKGQIFSSDCFNNATQTPVPLSTACTSCREGVYNRFSILFFSLLFLMMSNLQAISGLCRERSLFYRERAAGLYTTWSYFSSGTLVYLPVIVVSTVIFCTIMFFFVGLYPTTESYLYFLIVNFLTNLIGYFMAQLIAACTPTADIALSLFPLSFIFFNVFAGFLIHLPKMPKGWVWAATISFIRWAIQGIVINEVEPQPQLRYSDGQDILAVYGFDNHSKWTSIYVLVAIAVVLRITTYLFLEYKRFGTT